jgi:hypothetical protein
LAGFGAAVTLQRLQEIRRQWENDKSTAAQVILNMCDAYEDLYVKFLRKCNEMNRGSGESDE